MASIREYAATVFDAIKADANQDGLWTGNLTAVIGENAPIAHYSRIRDVLKRSGAMEQVQRGGGPSPSIWQIMDRDIDLATATLRGKAPSPGVDGKSKTEQRLEALEGSIGDLDVRAAIADLALDIRTLKKVISGTLDVDNVREEVTNG